MTKGRRFAAWRPPTQAKGDNMSILTRSQASGNSGGVVQVIQPPEEERLSYQLPAGIYGQIAGDRLWSHPLPPGRYTEVQPQRDHVVWLEDTAGQSWRVLVDDIAPYALDPDAHTARQVARRKAYEHYRALDWCERMLDLCDQWEGVVDHLPCDDATAEAIGSLLDKLTEMVRGVKAPNTPTHAGS